MGARATIARFHPRIVLDGEGFTGNDARNLLAELNTYAPGYHLASRCLEARGFRIQGELLNYWRQ